MIKGTLFASRMEIECQLIKADNAISPDLRKRGEAPQAQGTVCKARNSQSVATSLRIDGGGTRLSGTTLVLWRSLR